MSQNVSFIITAQDKASAVIRQTAKSIDGLSKQMKGLASITKLAFGAFAAKEVGTFLKQSMEAAAQHDKALAKSMESVQASFYGLKVTVGTTILGNAGVIAALDTLTQVFGAIANAAKLGLGGVEPLLKGMVFKIAQLVGYAIRQIAQLYEAIPGLGVVAERLANIGLKMELGGMAGFNEVKADNPNIWNTPKITPPGKGGPRGMTPAQIDRRIGPVGAPRLLEPTGVDNQFAQGLKEYGAAGIDMLGEQIIPEMEDAMEPLRQAFQDSFANALAGGIGAGFEQLFASGDIGKGFQALAGTLLSGLGSAMMQFGEASLAASLFMEKIKNSLASFLPGGAVAASLAMIGLGAALKAAAGKAFGGMGRTTASHAVSGTRSTFSGGTEAFTERGTVVVEVPRDAMVRPTDPSWQDFMRDTVAAAQGRRLVFRPR